MSFYVTLRDLRIKLKKVKDRRMMEDLMSVYVTVHFTDTVDPLLSNHLCTVKPPLSGPPISRHLCLTDR